MHHQFKIDIFEGPLDLLLHLIREQKMDIYDIPIAEITQQYVRYLDLLKELNLDVAGEYLVMAAELTRIKSKMLLPRQEMEEDEKEEGEDPRDELMRRLLEYQRFKVAAFELRKMEYETQQVFTRKGPLIPETGGGDGEIVEANVFDLLSAFQGILKGRKLKDDYEVKITALSVAEKIDRFLEILNASESVTFSSLFTVLNTKVEVIVTFLALLELIRLRLVNIQQTGHFETIRIYLTADKEAQKAALQDYSDSFSPQEQTEI